MTKIAVMIIYFGLGYYAQFDTERYDNLAECEAAKRAVFAMMNDAYYGAPAIDQIVCVEVSHDH